MSAELKSCGCVIRHPANPVLTGADVPYDSDLVFNAGVIRYRGKYVMVFRNDYHHIEGGRFEGTNIGLAFSDDGIAWRVEPKPCLDPREDRVTAMFDTPPGEITRCYDPRLTEIDGRVCMTFAVDTLHGLRGGVAVTDDFEHFELKSLSVPDNRNMVLFPEKIRGRYMRLERPMPVYSRGRDRFDIWISESPDLVCWGRSALVAGVEDFPYADDKIGPGAPPVRTERGWLVLTHGVDRDNTRGKNGWEDVWQKRYCAGMMLLDLEEPRKVLGISRTPLIAPETPYETENGFRTNVIFPTAAIPEPDGTLKIYYGAADTVIALATAPTERLAEICLAGGEEG